MANFTTEQKRGRPRKNTRAADLERVDIRALFRAQPNLYGSASIVLGRGEALQVVQIKYYTSAVARPQPLFVCTLCSSGVRIMYGPRSLPTAADSDVRVLVCSRCAKADPDSHNLTGLQRSKRRTQRLRGRLNGGNLRQKAKWQQWETYAGLRRGLLREADLREEIRVLREMGVSRINAERSAAMAPGTSPPAALTDSELLRALRALHRKRNSGRRVQ